MSKLTPKGFQQWFRQSGCWGWLFIAQLCLESRNRFIEPSTKQTISKVSSITIFPIEKVSLSTGLSAFRGNINEPTMENVSKTLSFQKINKSESKRKRNRRKGPRRNQKRLRFVGTKPHEFESRSGREVSGRVSKRLTLSLYSQSRNPSNRGLFSYLISSENSKQIPHCFIFDGDRRATREGVKTKNPCVMDCWVCWAIKAST